VAEIKHLDNGNIVIVIDTSDRAFLMDDLAEHDGDASDRDLVHEILADELGNGWSEVPPEAIGALTERLILSDNITYNDNSEWVFVDDPPRLWITNECDEYVHGLVKVLLDKGQLIMEKV
jgi:hypothetical protein